MKEIVRFFDRQQVEGNEWSKAVVVRKINDEEQEDKVVHPKYIERTDKYVITLYYRVVDVQEVSYSESLEDVELMATELQRILDLTWNPTTGTSPWFITNYYWTSDDHLDSNQPELRRNVQIRLTNVTGADPQVYTGFDGTLIFDSGDSVGDTLPAGDVQYESMTEVHISEGWVQIPYLTKDQRLGAGVPQLGRGAFAGTFTALTFANRANLEGNTLDKIPQIYLPQTNAPQIGQQASVVFLHVVKNDETTPSVMTTKSFMKINSIEQISEDISLVQYRINGTLIKASEVSFS
jgi:hypothetical protein